MKVLMSPFVFHSAPAPLPLSIHQYIEVTMKDQNDLAADPFLWSRAGLVPDHKTVMYGVVGSKQAASCQNPKTGALEL